MELRPGTDIALRVVQEVLRDVLQADRVMIDTTNSEGGGWSYFEVRPVRSHACPISIAAEPPPEISLFLGREPIVATFEVWGDDHEANLQLLRELVEAVAAGRYEQTVQTFKHDRIRVKGRFQLEGRDETHDHSTSATAAVKPDQTYVLQFEPY
jgi:hypothetical protein